jgi:PKD repeat protein
VPPTDTPTPVPPPPSLGELTVNPPDGIVAVDDPIDFTVDFTDPGAVGLMFTWFWNDESTSTCPPDTQACSVDPGTGTVGQLSASHAYSEPGIYTVQVTAEDPFGQFDTATYEFVVVYDPNGGFVTGGGWINSLKGAYKPDPTVTGKATFGFVSKYKSGATQPTGNTVFQFRAAGLNFHSVSYDWLVVTGGNSATLKGSGTINGNLAPNDQLYKFKMWADDGSPDTLRVKIWYEGASDDVVVYDNGFGQSVADGSIVIHGSRN